MLKVMFQAWLVKISNTQASSAPNTRPGNRFRKNTTVKVRKPRIGTDCRMSGSGISTISGLRLFAASAAYTKEKMMWQTMRVIGGVCDRPIVGGKGGGATNLGGERRAALHCRICPRKSIVFEALGRCGPIAKASQKPVTSQSCVFARKPGPETGPAIYDGFTTGVSFSLNLRSNHRAMARPGWSFVR